jgi:carboxypeptidase PM20D1
MLAWIILLIILVPLLVAVVHAALIKAKPSDARPLPVSPEARERAGEVLSDMVRCPTISHVEASDLPPFFELHKVLEKHFPLLHSELEKEVLDGGLMFHWKGKNDSLDPILLIAHQDVVPADPQGWKYPPFDGVVADGCVWGRGSFDCKSTIYAVMEGVEQLLREGFEPESDVWLAFATNEENSGDSAYNMSRLFKERGIHFRLVLDEGGAILQEALPGMDRPFAMVGVCEKGSMDLRFHAAGRGGHSSTPPRNNPLARLARFVSSVENKKPFRKELSHEVRSMMQRTAPYLPFPMRFMFGNLWLTAPLLKLVMPKVSPFGEAIMSTTCVFTMAQGSDTANVIPSSASVTANLRPIGHQPCQASIEALRPLAEKNDLEIEVLMQRDPSPISNIDDPRYVMLEQVIRQSFPDCGTAPYVVMAGTDSRHYTIVSDMVLRFQPIRVSDEELAAMHGINERVSLDALVEGSGFISRLIQAFCK